MPLPRFSSLENKSAHISRSTLEHARYFIACLFTALLLALSPHALANPEDQFWSADFSLAGFDDEVQKVVSDGQGNLYATGRFTFVDGIRVDGLAKWNGNAWSAVAGSNVQNRFITDIAPDLFGNLYVAGNFPLNDGTFSSLVFWDGANAIDLIGPLASQNPNFQAIEIPSSGAVVAAGSVFINNRREFGVYQFDGFSWTLLGGENFEYLVNNTNQVQFNDIAIDESGNIVVAGQFETVGGKLANSMAVWDGSAWSPLESGVIQDVGLGATPGEVKTIAIDDASNYFFPGLST